MKIRFAPENRQIIKNYTKIILLWFTPSLVIGLTLRKWSGAQLHQESSVRVERPRLHKSEQGLKSKSNNSKTSTTAFVNAPNHTKEAVVKIPEKFLGVVARRIIEGGSGELSNEVKSGLQLSENESMDVHRIIIEIQQKLRDEEAKIRVLTNGVSTHGGIRIPTYSAGEQIAKDLENKIEKIFPGRPDIGRLLAKMLSQNSTFGHFGRIEEFVKCPENFAGSPTPKLLRYTNSGNKLHYTYISDIDSPVAQGYTSLFQFEKNPKQ